jgi:hypothetical protein
MRNLLLTGIAEETDFNSAKTTYFLVFDKGVARVPTTQEGAEQVLALLTANEKIESLPREMAIVFEAAESSGRELGEVYEKDDNGVGQI